MGRDYTNIQLERIRTERFAKDMRDAIYNAIKQIGSDTYNSLDEYQQEVQSARRKERMRHRR